MSEQTDADLVVDVIAAYSGAFELAHAHPDEHLRTQQTHALGILWQAIESWRGKQREQVRSGERSILRWRAYGKDLEEQAFGFARIAADAVFWDGKAVELAQLVPHQ